MECPDGSSDTIQVTKTTDTTWDIEALDTDVACVMGFDGIGNNFLGLYNMPFLMEVQLK